MTSMPRFGVTAWEISALKAAAQGGQTAIAQNTHKKVADLLSKIFDSGPLGNLFSKDLRVRGMSMEDVAARSLTLFGLYIPQGFLAVKEQRHPWETNGRNAIMWGLAIFLTQFLKNENFGVNSLFLNPLMIEKGRLKAFNPKADIPPDAGFFTRALQRAFKPSINWVQRLANRRFGMDGDYLAVLQDSGIAVSQDETRKALMGIKAPWAALDNNKIDLINHRYTELKTLVERDGIEALGKLQQPVSQSLYRAYPKVLRRLNIFPLISTSIIVAATVYVIGGLAMIPVYKFFAPLDKDFDAEAYRRSREKKKSEKKKKKDRVPEPSPPTHYGSVTSFPQLGSAARPDRLPVASPPTMQVSFPVTQSAFTSFANAGMGVSPLSFTLQPQSLQAPSFSLRPSPFHNPGGAR